MPSVVTKALFLLGPVLAIIGALLPSTGLTAVGAWWFVLAFVGAAHRSRLRAATAPDSTVYGAATEQTRPPASLYFAGMALVAAAGRRAR